MDDNPYKSPADGYRRWADLSPRTLTALKILLVVYLTFMGGLLYLGLLYMFFIWRMVI